MRFRFPDHVVEAKRSPGTSGRWVTPREVVILIKARFWRELHEDLRANAEFQGSEYVETTEVVINERLRVREDAESS